MNPLNWNWSWQAILAGIILVPVWLAIPFFAKNLNIRPEIAVNWYFLGVSLGSPILLRIFSEVPKTDFFPDPPKIYLLLIGLTAGALINILLFAAVNNAPNPALATTLSGGVSNIIMFTAAFFLAIYLPAYFNPVEFGVKKFLGILTVVLGIFLISL